VQVARYPGALLGGGQPALPLALALGAAGALLELREPLAALAHLVADQPRTAPHESAEQDRVRREAVVGDHRAANVQAEQREHREPGAAEVRLGALVGRHEEERERGPERRAEPVAARG